MKKVFIINSCLLISFWLNAQKPDAAMSKPTIFNITGMETFQTMSIENQKVTIRTYTKRGIVTAVESYLMTSKIDEITAINLLDTSQLIKDGYSRNYNEEGKMINEAFYNNGSLNPVPKDESTVFVLVEEMPEFPGSKNALRNFIGQNVIYPIIAAENGIQGKVFVTFVVDKDGSVSNTKITRGVDPSLDQEAMRVVNYLPKWKPGKQKGKPVRVSYTVPINFQLQ